MLKISPVYLNISLEGKFFLIFFELFYDSQVRTGQVTSDVIVRKLRFIWTLNSVVVLNINLNQQ